MRVLRTMPQGVRHAAIYAAALGLSKATAVAMLPVFTHFLSPADYGRLDVLQTLANLLSIVIGFGMADTLFRFAGAAETDAVRRDQAAQIFGLAVMASVISLAVTQAAAPWIANMLPGDPGLLNTRVILASLSVTGAILVPLSWLRMQDKAFGYFAGSAGRALAQAGLVAIFLALGFGVEGVLVGGMICALCLAIILSVLQWRDTGIKLSFGTITRQGRFGGTLVLAGIATFILDSCDRWILAGTVGTEALAHYALAGKIGIMAAFLTQPFDMWWLPKRFSVLQQSDGAIRCARMTELGLCIAMIAALSIAAIGPFVVLWMTPVAYHGAIVFVPVLAGLAALNAGTTLINTGVLSEEKTTKPIWIDGGAALLAVLGYLTLIPVLGAWGAVWATVAALCARFIAYAVLGARQRAVPYRFSALAVPAAFLILGLIQCTAMEDPIARFAAASLTLLCLTIAAVVLKLIPLPSRMTIRAA